MTCTQTQTLLDAYADSELSRLAAFRVRRHLTACTICAADLADIQRLSTAVRTWRDVPAPAALEGRLAAVLPPFALPPTPRNRRIARRAAVGLAGVAAAIGAGFWLLPGKPSQPTIAFADVQKAMQQVQIVSWKSHIIITDADWRPLHNQKSAGSDSTTWLRRNPPAIATIGQPSGFTSLTDERGNLEHTAQDNYVTFPPRQQGEGTLAEDVEKQIRVLTEKPTTRFTDSTHTVYSSLTNLEQQLVLVSGQKRILFTFEEDTTVRAFVSHGRVTRPEMHYFTHGSNWVDPATRLVTRIEIRSWGDKMSGQINQRQIIIVGDFHYNQAPPPGVFDWSPPKGANVINSRDLRVGKGLRLHLPKKAAK